MLYIIISLIFLLFGTSFFSNFLLKRFFSEFAVSEGIRKFRKSMCFYFHLELQSMISVVEMKKKYTIEQKNAYLLSLIDDKLQDMKVEEKEGKSLSDYFWASFYPAEYFMKLLTLNGGSIDWVHSSWSDEYLNEWNKKTLEEDILRAKKQGLNKNYAHLLTDLPIWFSQYNKEYRDNRLYWQKKFKNT